MNPNTFIAKYIHATVNEKAFYQSHFIDLCALIGVPDPLTLDPHGDFFRFEAGATKSTGGQGFADVWYKDHFAWEYKGKHRDLEAAFQQLLLYHDALGNPPLLIVSDAHTIIIRTKITNSPKREFTFTLDDLLKPASLALLKTVFEDPFSLKAPQTTEQVTQTAAAQFAKVSTILRKYGDPPEKIAHFLIRILFCLFAEDIGLLPPKLFTRMLENTRTKPKALCAQLQQLFLAMSSGGYFGSESILHFNGHLFDNAEILDMDSDSIDTLLQVSNLDWSQIKPSIFGTLFERSLDPTKRSQLGAHYTGEEDILLIIEPVLMAPLRRRWDEIQQQARSLAAERDAEKGPKRPAFDKKISSLLLGFTDELAQIKVLDAACGSGNFLYIALRQLLDLWKDVSLLAAELGLPMMIPAKGLAPHPAQLHGIEINPYAQQLAQATIWIGYIQWFVENGFGFPPEPILSALENIQQMDAILAFDADGKPYEPEWPQADVIIGNPPFLGGKRLRAELGDSYVDSLYNLYENIVPHQADLVCYWFAKSWQQLVHGSLNRAGLLATQNIRSGQNRVVLDQILKDGQIFMAWSDREWVLEGAAVRVSMVGFDQGSETNIQLDDKAVGRIHSNLTSAVDTTKARSLRENAGLCPRTDEKGGAFEISHQLAKKMLEMPLNVNGRPNSDVIIPWLSGVDVVHENRNLWIIDFGIDMSQNDASQYEAPFQYLEQYVKPERMQNRIERFRDKWWIHRGPGISMREAREKLKTRYIATLRVSRHPVFVFIEKKYLPDVRLIFFAREDEYFLGVLQSRVHITWYLETGTKHGVGNDPTYIPTATFETYPFPWPPGKEPADDPRVQAIAQAAKDLVEKRDRWLNPEGAAPEELKKRTLTNLYNARPTWLDLAHKKLDHAVFAAYGWPANLTDEQILERLLALNLERAMKQA